MSSEESSSQEVTQETEGGCDPVDSGNAPAWSIIEKLDRHSINEWRRYLKIEIEKASEVLPPTQKIYKEFKKLWADFKGNRAILAAEINEFVGTSLNRALLSNKDEGNRIPNTKTNVRIDIKKWTNSN